MQFSFSREQSKTKEDSGSACWLVVPIAFWIRSHQDGKITSELYGLHAETPCVLQSTFLTCLLLTSRVLSSLRPGIDAHDHEQRRISASHELSATSARSKSNTSAVDP